jgi:very-short-patch-repair endonuclease
MAEILSEMKFFFMKEKGFFANSDSFYFADFYLPKPYYTVIEVDGGYHENLRAYDEGKDNYYVHKRRFKVIRFKNEEVSRKI